MSAGGRQSTVGGNALAKVSVNGTHLEAQMGALLSSVILPHHALEMPCAGYGRCGKCRVVAHGALSALSDAEREHLSPQDISRGVRLACCARVEGDCTVTLEGAAASQIRLAGEMPDFVHDPIFSVCGAAVDIGTTTLASCLYGPDGTLLAQASAPNPQAGWGADVISRIEAALHGSGDALAASVRAGVRALVLEMAASAHISAEAVDALVITGNTAMLYLLTQTDPDCLSHAPFAASRLFGETLAAGELGLPCPHAQVYLPRCMSAFVGADITTALLASGICSKPDTRMLVDIGTNGEIALWHRGQLSCCSTAAGPAFEGAGLSMGMAGKTGAVDHVRVQDGASGAGPCARCAACMPDAERRPHGTACQKRHLRRASHAAARGRALRGGRRRAGRRGRLRQLSGCKQRGPHRPSARRTRSPCARAGKRGLERRGHAFAEQGLYPPQRGPGCRSEDGGPFHQRGIHERLYRRYVFLTLPKGLAKNVPVLYTVAYTIAYCAAHFRGSG